MVDQTGDDLDDEPVDEPDEDREADRLGEDPLASRRPPGGRPRSNPGDSDRVGVGSSHAFAPILAIVRFTSQSSRIGRPPPPALPRHPPDSPGNPWIAHVAGSRPLPQNGAHMPHCGANIGDPAPPTNDHRGSSCQCPPSPARVRSGGPAPSTSPLPSFLPSGGAIPQAPPTTPPTPTTEHPLSRPPAGW